MAVRSWEKGWDKIATIFIGAVFACCVLCGIYASVSAGLEFRNYDDLENKCQTVQGEYISYEVDYPGRYGATKRMITVDDRQYQVRSDELDEDALKNDLKQGDPVTLIVDSKRGNGACHI
ncbi:MAG: hypothetical protein IKJ35_05765 [Clostridia bacterium]|nr:hypothetical protein [Clostridia bacterium]